MRILRTPNSRFENLSDYPFAPHYTTIQTEDGSELRIHHLDEGLPMGRWCYACMGNRFGVICTVKSFRI